MIAVSDTTPLRYLIAIDQEHLLPQIFEKVFIPVAVFEELTEPRTPEKVRHRILARPVWLEVRAVQETQSIAFPLIQGLVTDFSHSLQQLKASGFYVSDTLEKQLLQRHIGRRGK